MKKESERWLQIYKQKDCDKCLQEYLTLHFLKSLSLALSFNFGSINWFFQSALHFSVNRKPFTEENSIALHRVTTDCVLTF